MIFLVGAPTDDPLRTVAEELSTLEEPFQFFDPCLSDVHLIHKWEPGREATIAIAREELNLDSVSAAYLRPYSSVPGSPRRHAALLTVLAWADTTKCAVLNRPEASVLNMSKPTQLRLIRECGFLTPRTLLTTTVEDVIDFRKEVGELIYKSVGSIRSIVRRLPHGFSDFDNVSNCPTQFQEYIPGNDVRVHVLGTNVYPLLIRTDSDDYRYAQPNGEGVEMAPTVLPTDLEESVVSMVQRMGLVFAGVDLRQHQSGDWYCLEVNPSPGFTFYERLSGIRLAPVIATYLADASRYFQEQGY